MKSNSNNTENKNVFVPGVRINVHYIKDNDKYYVEKKGTVIIVDAQNTIHVKLDNGLCLGLIYGQDEFEITD